MTLLVFCCPSSREEQYSRLVSRIVTRWYHQKNLRTLSSYNHILVRMSIGSCTTQCSSV